MPVNSPVNTGWLQDYSYLGNIDSKRDWGYAKDYVEAMWLMLQQDDPDDFVIATGQSRSVKEWVVASFESLDMDWEKYVKIDQKFIRPAEVDLLIGDSSKAQRVLGWKPKVNFEQLVKIMVEYDYNQLKKANNI